MPLISLEYLTFQNRRKAFFWYNAVLNNPNATDRSKYHADIMDRVSRNAGFQLTNKEKELLKILTSSQKGDKYQKDLLLKFKNY